MVAFCSDKISALDGFFNIFSWLSVLLFLVVWRIFVFLTPTARCWVGAEGLSRLDCSLSLHKHRPPEDGQVPAGQQCRCQCQVSAFTSQKQCSAPIRQRFLLHFLPSTESQGQVSLLWWKLLPLDMKSSFRTCLTTWASCSTSVLSTTQTQSYSTTEFWGVVMTGHVLFLSQHLFSFTER